MSIQTKTMTVKSDTSLAETTTTIRDTVTFDVSNMPNGITYKGLKAVLSFADPIQWNKASTYDALTVVWDDASHGSYASKRPVPQNIELTNEFYWLRTADLDAQVEMYRQEVMEFDGRITANTNAIDDEVTRAESAEQALQTSIETVEQTLQTNIESIKRKCICIGNSFTIGYYTHNYGIGDYIANSHMFAETYVYGKDSSSFDNYTLNNVTIDNTNNFNSMVNEASSDSRFKNTDITDIIFISAMGDTRALAYKQANNKSLEFDNMGTTIANAKNLFPNAKVYIVFAEWISKRNTGMAYSNNIPFMQNRAHWLFSTQSDAIYLGWVSLFGNLNATYDKYRMPDGYHPSAEGSKILGCEVLKRLTGNSNQRLNYFYVAMNEANDAIVNTSDKSAESFMNIETPISPLDFYFNTKDKTSYGAGSKIRFCIGDGVTDTQLPIMQIQKSVNFLTYRKNGTNEYAQSPCFCSNVYDKENGKMYVEIIPTFTIDVAANSNVVINNLLTTSYTEFPVIA